MTGLHVSYSNRADEHPPGGGDLARWNGDAEDSQASRRLRYVTTRAESAPCMCPDFCERDHEND